MRVDFELLKKMLEGEGFKFERGRIVFHGMPHILLGSEYLKRFREVVELSVGKEMAKLTVYRVAKRDARAYAKKISKRHGVEKFLKKLVRGHALKGWGKLDIIYKSEEGIFAFSSPNSLESEVLKEKNEKVCDFQRGLLAGLFSGFFDKDFECEELKCRASGEKKCIFLIYESQLPKEELEKVKEAIL